MKAWIGVVAGSMLFLASAVAQDLPSACGPRGQAVSVRTNKKEHPPVAEAPGTATLVFVQREPPCLGCDVVRVGVDGSWVGGNKGTSWFSVPVAPGERHVCAWWKKRGLPMRYAVDLADLKVEMGKVYYLEDDVNEGGLYEISQVRLRPISADEAKFLISKAAHATSGP